VTVLGRGGVLGPTLVLALAASEGHDTADTSTGSEIDVPDSELDARYDRLIQEADAVAQAHAAHSGSADNPLGELCSKVGYLAARLARAEARLERLEAGDD
jgi:hypothetical protein